MSEWKEVRLGEVVTFQRGHDLPKHLRQEGNIPVAGSNGIIGFHNEFTTDPPGITIGRSGTIGNPNYYATRFWAHNTVLYVKNFHGNSAKFIYYLLKTIDFNGFNSGSAVPSLNRNFIHEMSLRLPPLPEQQAIARVLSGLDDKIDLLHRQNQTLEAMAQTLFRQWFIEEAQEEWEEGSLLELLELRGGGTPKTSIAEYWEGTIPWLSGGDISQNDKNFVATTEKSITELGLANSAAKQLPKFSSVISARGTVGKICMLAKPMAYSQSNYGILPCDTKSYFFTYLLLSYVVEGLQAAAHTRQD